MILIIYIVSVLDGLSFAMVITALGPYILSLGGSNFLLGVMGSISACISLIWNPLVGGLSDRNGRKKVLLQIMTVCLVANFLTGIASSVWLVFAARLLSVLGSPIMSLFKSLISDNVQSEDEQMAIMNKMQSCAGVCFLIGPLLGGFLSELENGYNYVFYFVSLVFVINIGLVSLIESKEPAKTTKSNDPLSVTKELKAVVDNLKKIDWERFWDLFTIKSMVDLSFGMFHFAWLLVLTETYHLEGRYIGYTFAFISVIGILTSLSMIKLKNFLYPDDRLGLNRLLHGSVLMLISFLTVGVVQNLTLFLICLIPMSIGKTLIDTTMTESILIRAKPSEKGGIMGTFDSTISLSGLVSPLIGGITTEVYGPQLSLASCAIPLLFNGIVINYKKLKNNKTNQ